MIKKNSLKMLTLVAALTLMAGIPASAVLAETSGAVVPGCTRTTGSCDA
ncbi:MAG: hypothetical protein LC667_10085 [Thioalkalivibrio sp.]|nr:hypothetical protein [Thioalkalivibrio sp.]